MIDRSAIPQIHTPRPNPSIDACQKRLVDRYRSGGPWGAAAKSHKKATVRQGMEQASAEKKGESSLRLWLCGRGQLGAVGDKSHPPWN